MHRQDTDFQIYSEPNAEPLLNLKLQPVLLYSSYYQYLNSMALAATYLGQPELIDADLLYNLTFNVIFSNEQYPVRTEHPRQYPKVRTVQSNVEALWYPPPSSIASRSVLIPHVSCFRILSFSQTIRASTNTADQYVQRQFLPAWVFVYQPIQLSCKMWLSSHSF